MTHPDMDDGRARAYLDVRCADRRCRWFGYTPAIRSYGAWTWQMEDCPWCTGRLERGDWTHDHEE